MSTLIKIFFTITLIFTLFPFVCLAAPSTDNDNGIYTDDFTNTIGISSSSNAGVNSEVVQLKNAGGTYTAPYQTSGYVITKNITALMIAKWSTASISATIPEGTSIKLQLIDTNNAVYSEQIISGNSEGSSTFPVDISLVPLWGSAELYTESVNQAIRIKLILSTVNTDVTPLVNDLTVTWTTKQGDLTTSLISADDPWPMDYGNRQLTALSKYANSQIYPAFKWAADKSIGIGNDMIDLYVLEDKLVGKSWYGDPKMLGINRDNGSLLWSIPYNQWQNGIITKNGTFFGTDMGYDLLSAIDTTSGQIKWSYDFIGGHGNSMVSIGNDGTLYTFRSGATYSDVILKAYSQDGTNLWDKEYDFDEIGDDSVSTTPIAFGNDGTMYFGYVASDSESTTTGHGKLVAVDPENGDIIWEYETGDIRQRPIVDSNGIIYALNYYNEYPDITTPWQKKLYAINPDGTLKWIKNFELDIYKNSYSEIALRDDGKIIVSMPFNDNYEYKLYVINSNDGSIFLTSDLINTPSLFFVDSLNGNCVYNYDYEDDIYYEKIRYFDANGETKWKIQYQYSEMNGDNYEYYSFEDGRIDERGWIYIGFEKYSYDSEWNDLLSEFFVQPFALAPWTLTPSLNASFYQPGNIMTFTVSSSMLSSNPLFGGDNQVQVVMDNEEKIPLSYSSTDGSGNSIWTGTYTLPIDTTHGTHTYTVEAQQPSLETDITTHFASASTETNNTGIITTGSFTVGTADVPRPETPSSSPPKSSSTPPQNQVVGNSGGNITFNQEEQGMHWQVKVVLGPSTSLPPQTHIWVDKRTEDDILASNSVIGKPVSIPKSIVNSSVTKIYEFDPSNYQTGIKINTLPSPVQIYLPLTKSLDSTNGISVLRYDSSKKTWVRLNTSIVLTSDKKQVVFVTNQSGLYILSSSGGTYQFASANTKYNKTVTVPEAVKGVNTMEPTLKTTTTTKPKLAPKNTRCFLWWCF